MPAFEVLINTPAISNLIREGKTFQIPSTMQVGVEHGMITFDSYLTKMVSEGKVNKEDADTFLGKKKKDANGGGGLANSGRGINSNNTATGIRITSSDSQPGFPLPKKKIG